MITFKGSHSTRRILLLSVSAGLLVQSVAGADPEAASKAAIRVRSEVPAAAGTADRETKFGSLRGVTLAPGGFSLAAVSIVIHSLTGTGDRQLVSDPEGVFRLDDLQPGTYQI